MSIKTRLEKLEAKALPKPKPIRPMLRIIERHIDLEGLDDDGIPVMIMGRPTARAKDMGQDTLTINIIETRKGGAAAIRPDPEPDDDELEAEVERLEARKAELMAKE